MLAGQSDRAMFSHEASASQMTLVCVMLTKNEPGQTPELAFGLKELSVSTGYLRCRLIAVVHGFFCFGGGFIVFFSSVHIALVFVYLFVCFSFWSGSF